MISDNDNGRSVIKWHLPINILTYLLEFLEIHEALRMSQLNKSFKKSFLALIQKSKKLELNQKHTNKDYLFLFKLISQMENLKELKLQLIDYKEKNFQACLIKHYPVNFSLEKLSITTSPYPKIDPVLIDYILSHMSSFKNLIHLEIIDLKINHDGFEKFLSQSADILVNLKTIVIRNNDINNYKKINIKNLLNFSQLEVINFSNNSCKEIATFIAAHIESFPNLKEFNFAYNSIVESIGINIVGNLTKAKNLSKVDLSGNFLKRKVSNIQDILSVNKNIKTLILTDNKIDPIASERRVMRMLFSRSGIISQIASNRTNGDIIGKSISSKNNEAILPQYIYSSPPKLNFTKEELIRILKRENLIRISEESKRIFDENRHRPIEIHLDLDKQMIKRALYECGYFPDEDDSLKAYHLATTEFINYPDVREEVVWMKYDKCKIGRYHVGDKPRVDGLFLYNLQEEKIEFKNILSSTRPNLIVSGSAS